MRPFRSLARAVPLLALVGWGGLAVSAPRGPTVDRKAMREAVAPSTPRGGLVSAASYAHALRAQLLSLDKDHRGAVDELRLALVTDEGNPRLLTRLGEEYAQAGELAQAERELRRAVGLHPSFYEARVMLGQVLMAADKAARAQEQLRSAIRLAPREPEAYLLLAQLHLEQHAPAQAEKVVEALAVALPGETSGYRRLGLALAEQGDDLRARRMLERALERDPGDVESLVALARLHEKAGRLAEAEDTLARALEHDPDSQTMLVSAGRLALGLGSPVRARAYFDRLLSLSSDPELSVQVAVSFLSAHDLADAARVLDGARQAHTASPRMAFYSGLVHERLHHFAQAAAAYAEVPETADLSSTARTRRGICLSQVGQHPEALELLRQALAEHPEEPSLTIELARAQERAGEGEHAVSTLQEALARKPEAELREALVSTLRRQKRPAEALALLHEAISQSPRDVAPRYLLATVLQEDGDTQGALSEMRGVLALDPQHAAAMNFIGYLLAQHGQRLAEAERLVRRALVLRPDTGSFLDSLGFIHAQRGEATLAVQELRRAVELEPDEPVILEHLGDALQRASRPTEAAEAWRRALEALALEPEAADPPDQRALLERKLKLLSTGAADR